MRISVISAVVCCALFPLASAAGLNVEQRLTQLEARLSPAEQRAGEASRRAQQAGQQTTAVEQRATAAEQQVQALSQQTTAREQKRQTINRQLSKQLVKHAPDDDFIFNAYVHSGMLVNSHGKGARGGPGASPANSPDGDAHIGCFDNGKNNYAELSFSKKLTFNDGSWARFKIILVDGATNPDPWIQDNDSHHLNIRQLYVGMGGFAEFTGPLEHVSIWADKHFDRDNFNIHFTNSDIMFLGGTGGRINDIDWGSGLHGDYSVYARSFGGLGNNNYVDNDIQNLLFITSHFYNNRQLMATVMTAQGNDGLKDNASTAGSYVLRSDNTAKNGYYVMLALHDKQQLYGLAPGVSESALQYGVGLGAEVRQPRNDGDLTENMASLRSASCEILPPGRNWQLAPSVIAQHSEDRYRDSDCYDWATFNLRVSQGISAHFALLYEASWQYVDLNPNGCSYRYNNNIYQYQVVRDDFYKLTSTPTFKVGDMFGIKTRLEVCLFVTWMNWDKDLDRYTIDDDFDNKGSTTGEAWNFGAQTKIQF